MRRACAWALAAVVVVFVAAGLACFVAAMMLEVVIERVAGRDF